MEDFDFENIEVTDENFGEEEFFSDEDDGDEEDPSGGVRLRRKPKNPTGSHGKKLDEKELAIL